DDVELAEDLAHLFAIPAPESLREVYPCGWYHGSSQKAAARIRVEVLRLRGQVRQLVNAALRCGHQIRGGAGPRCLRQLHDFSGSQRASHGRHCLVSFCCSRVCKKTTRDGNAQAFGTLAQGRKTKLGWSHS